jgi:hypothetical protein
MEYQGSGKFTTKLYQRGVKEYQRGCKKHQEGRGLRSTRDGFKSTREMGSRVPERWVQEYQREG